MKGINKVLILGNLGVDPEVKYMSNGNKVVVLSIATSRAWKDKSDGNIVSKTDWHRVVLYNKLAEVASDFLKKGFKVFIEGSLRYNRWQDKNNIVRYTTEIHANNIQILTSKNEANILNNENITNNDSSYENADENDIIN